MNNASLSRASKKLKKKWKTNHNTIADDIKALYSEKHIKPYPPEKSCKWITSNSQSLNSNRRENEIDVEKAKVLHFLLYCVYAWTAVRGKTK